MLLSKSSFSIIDPHTDPHSTTHDHLQAHASTCQFIQPFIIGKGDHDITKSDALSRFDVQLASSGIGMLRSFLLQTAANRFLVEVS